jgi:hypothetical protein
LVYLWDNFDSCLGHARTHFPAGTHQSYFPSSDNLIRSAVLLYNICRNAECGTPEAVAFKNLWLLRYKVLLDAANCKTCKRPHILCCELRQKVQPPALEHYLYLKQTPEHYHSHIYLPIPNQTWAMYICDHISGNMENLADVTLPSVRPGMGLLDPVFFGSDIIAQRQNQQLVKQMHTVLESGYRATPVMVRLIVRRTMANWLPDNDHPLCFQLNNFYIRNHLKQLYWDNFSLEFSGVAEDCKDRKIMYQIREHVPGAVFPGTQGNISCHHISEYMECSALEKLSCSLGGQYSQKNFGLISNDIAKVLLRLLSDPYILQATINSTNQYTGHHHVLDCQFPKLLLLNHSKLSQNQQGLNDYAWHVSEYLLYGLHTFEHVDYRTSRGGLIFEKYSWDYVPLLRAATVLSKYPLLLLWFGGDLNPGHSLISSINNGYLSLAIHDMDCVAIEMQMVGAPCTYLVRLYLEYLGKFALEIFASVHIKILNHFWWKYISELHTEAQATPPDCSCSPSYPSDPDDDDAFSVVEYNDIVNVNETIDIYE